MSEFREMDGADPLLDSITGSAEAMGAARVDRDHWIKKAATAGYSLRTIAEAAYLSHSAIAKILAR